MGGKLKYSRISALACGVALTLTGIQGAQAAPLETQAQVAPVNVVGSDEKAHDLFRAAMFFQGPYAETMLNVSSFDGLDETTRQAMLEAGQQTEATDLVDQVVAEIDQNNPEFFSYFVESLDSGLPSMTNEALNVAWEEIENTGVFAASLEEAAATQTYVPGETGITCGVVVVVGAAAVIAITAIAVGNVGLFINAAAGGNVVATVNWVKTRSSLAVEPSTNNTEYVADITEAFAEL